MARRIARDASHRPRRDVEEVLPAVDPEDPARRPPCPGLRTRRCRRRPAMPSTTRRAPPTLRRAGLGWGRPIGGNCEAAHPRGPDVLSTPRPGDPRLLLLLWPANCPDCVTPTPVGMRCRSACAAGTRPPRAAAFGGSVHAPATYALIAINVAVYLAEIASGPGGFNFPGLAFVAHYSLIGTSVAGQVVSAPRQKLSTRTSPTSSSTWSLLLLGRLFGRPSAQPVSCVYFASPLFGSFGALLLSGPHALTLGASGAIFGIFGAAFVIARGRGLDSVARVISVVLLFNLAFSVSDPYVSLGGHLGGLVAGGPVRVCDPRRGAGQVGAAAPARGAGGDDRDRCHLDRRRARPVRVGPSASVRRRGLRVGPGRAARRTRCCRGVDTVGCRR